MKTSLALAGDLWKFTVESCSEGNEWRDVPFVSLCEWICVAFSCCFVGFLLHLCSGDLQQNCAGVEYSFLGGMGLASLWNPHPSTDCALDNAETRCKSASCIVWKVCCWLRFWLCISSEAFAHLMRRTTPMASAFQERSKGKNWKKTCLKADKTENSGILKIWQGKSIKQWESIRGSSSLERWCCSIRC